MFSFGPMYTPYTPFYLPTQPIFNPNTGPAIDNLFTPDAMLPVAGNPFGLQSTATNGLGLDMNYQVSLMAMLQQVMQLLSVYMQQAGGNNPFSSLGDIVQAPDAGNAGNANDAERSRRARDVADNNGANRCQGNDAGNAGNAEDIGDAGDAGDAENADNNCNNNNNDCNN